jgi:hypothetical protein
MTDVDANAGYPDGLVEKNRGDIEQFFNDGVAELQMQGVVKFGGFYFKDGSARARTLPIEQNVASSEKWLIQFNEKYIGMSKDESERISRHEIQHAVFTENVSKDDTLWLFVFTPQFHDLYNRMLQYYAGKINEGENFVKQISTIPTDYSGLGNANINYTHPDELLALLQGYKKYLDQQQKGISTKVKPYEFIEAFKEDDLQWLDRDYRTLAVDSLADRDKIINSKLKLAINYQNKIKWG